MCAIETSVFVTVVPMFAPMIIGIALARGSGFAGAATRPTIREVETEELCTRVVARTPTIRPMKGFSVARKKESSNPAPSDLNPSPRPLTPTRKTKSSRSTRAARTRGWSRGPRSRGSGMVVVSVNPCNRREGSPACLRVVSGESALAGSSAQWGQIEGMAAVQVAVSVSETCRPACLSGVGFLHIRLVKYPTTGRG